MSKRSLFGRSHAIERAIDEFLDKASACALVDDPCGRGLGDGCRLRAAVGGARSRARLVGPTLH
jgi:hypothetical protein